MTAQFPSITIEPIVSYPLEAEPGKTYLMTVDVRFPLDKEDWPYDDEEYEIYCLLDSAPLFDNEELGEAVIVLHRFGGTYGPAMFLLTANSAEMNEPIGAITLTLANRQLMPLQSFKLDKIRVSAKSTSASETVSITRQQTVSGVVKVDFNEQASELSTPTETDLLETETSSTGEAPASPPLILPPGIKLRHTISILPPAKQIAWSQDGKTFAATSGNPRIRFWDVEGEPKRKPDLGTPADVLGFDLSPDSLSFAAWLSNKEVWIGRINLSGTPRGIGLGAMITEVEWAPDGRWLGVATEEGQISLLNADDWNEVQRFSGDGSPARCLTWRRQGDYLLAGFDSGQLRLWSTHRSVRRSYTPAFQQIQPSKEDGEWVSTPRVYMGHKARVNSVAWSQDGLHFASGSEDGIVRVWRVDEPADNFQIALEGHTQPVMCVCFSPTDNLLASKSNDGTVRIWRMTTWQCVAVINPLPNTPDPTLSAFPVLAFHPSQLLLAVSVESHRVLCLLEIDQEVVLSQSGSSLSDEADSIDFDHLIFTYGIYGDTGDYVVPPISSNDVADMMLNFQPDAEEAAINSIISLVYQSEGQKTL